MKQYLVDGIIALVFIAFIAGLGYVVFNPIGTQAAVQVGVGREIVPVQNYPNIENCVVRSEGQAITSGGGLSVCASHAGVDVEQNIRIQTLEKQFNALESRIFALESRNGVSATTLLSGDLEYRVSRLEANMTSVQSAIALVVNLLTTIIQTIR